MTVWSASALVAVVLTTLPLLVISFGVFGAGSETWQHIVSTVLPDYLRNSAVLMVGVGALALLIGVTTAWLVAAYEFPGRSFFEWSLVLPLAVPTYIIAYTYAGIFDYWGPLQGMLESLWPTMADVHIRGAVMSREGAMLMMALVLYPYVYVITRASFLKQSTSALEMARLLGRGPWHTFFRVALPMARPAVAAGLTLVLMEVLNEYGAVVSTQRPGNGNPPFRAPAAVRVLTHHSGEAPAWPSPLR